MQFIERVVVVLAASAVASLALVAAGCGGDSSDPADRGGQSDNPVAFSECMRSHGVPDFPDPKITSGGGEVISIPDSDSPRFEAALKSCRKFLPDGGGSSPAQQAQEQDQLLRFARCMRARGVPDFPDPTVSGGRARFPAGRIDLGSPRFAAAKKACGQSLAGVTGG